MGVTVKIVDRMSRQFNLLYEYTEVNICNNHLLRWNIGQMPPACAWQAHNAT
jgi:hypothetical protein